MKNKKDLVPVIPPKEIIVGDVTAPVKMVMFGDYESEACSKANEVVKELLQYYEGKLNFNYRHFPMTRIHQKAHKAAEAAIGAAQEGKFWEMHQLLFKYHRNLGVISLKSYAREAGATDKKFLDNLISSYFGWYVQDDLKEGINLGIEDVPAFFINGVLFDKEPTLKNFKAHIDTLLRKETPAVIKLKEKKRA